jgi:hypothetical protein
LKRKRRNQSFEKKFAPPRIVAIEAETGGTFDVWTAALLAIINDVTENYTTKRKKKKIITQTDSCFFRFVSMVLNQSDLLTNNSVIK